MKYQIILALTSVTTLLTGCQLTSEYALMGGKQLIDSSNSYELQTDKSQKVDLSEENSKLKTEMVGKYTVVKQWNRIVRWNISTVDIHMNDNSVIVDLIGKNKQKPFYGFEVKNCRNFQTLDDSNNANKMLNHNGKRCGQLHEKNTLRSMVNMKSVKKGYLLNVNSSSNIFEWDTRNKFIIPEDGYILTINYAYFGSGGFAQAPGEAYITMYLKNN